MTDAANMVRELLDREAIRDCLTRYCRGADRCEPDLMKSAYWPDGTDSHAMPGRAPLNGHHFVDRAMAKLRRMDQTQHVLTNIHIRVDGAVAQVESYYHAYHRLNAAGGGKQDAITAGRYLDRMEKRGGEWRIRERVVVVDWFREFADSADWARGIFGGPCVMGARGGDDASFALFGREPTPLRVEG